MGKWESHESTPGGMFQSIVFPSTVQLSLTNCMSSSSSFLSKPSKPHESPRLCWMYGTRSKRSRRGSWSIRSELRRDAVESCSYLDLVKADVPNITLEL